MEMMFHVCINCDIFYKLVLINTDFQTLNKKHRVFGSDLII